MSAPDLHAREQKKGSPMGLSATFEKEETFYDNILQRGLKLVIEPLLFWFIYRKKEIQVCRCRQVSMSLKESLITFTLNSDFEVEPQVVN